VKAPVLPFTLFLLLSTACARTPPLFVTTNARAHISMLADTIGSRPVGTPANARAREYILDQMKQVGFDVRVQETDARRHELGLTARVSNIIGILPGQRPEAIAIIAHYDSSPDAPGATDDALGVGVALEAARVLAANQPRQWTICVILTDGEESGLMGAAALVADREVMNRLQAYLNLESIGSSKAPTLFETGPGNAWLVSRWARFATRPRGGSFALEIYKRLPNDTDFSILKTRDVPGLNFAPVGDSYAYHTARDTADRLSVDTIRTMGENVVAIVGGLQQTDITQRASQSATFFDIWRRAGVSYGPAVHWLTAALALLLGVIAWVRVTGDSVRENGVFRWLVVLIWSWLGAALAVAAMVGATWLLRSAREVYHPWYASPGRLFILLILVGVTVAWSITRLGQWLPRKAHPVRHPVLTWSIALPGWIALAALALWFAPSAAYLWLWPLLAAGLLLSVVPPRLDAAIRLASLVVLGIAGTLWLADTHDLLHFVVAVMGRLPIVTPSAAYAALIAAAGVMIAPPAIGVFAAGRALLRPWLITALLLLGTAAATGTAYLAPAYTPDRPLRRYARALQDFDAPRAIWEVASVEPGLDLGPGAPGGWSPSDASVPASVPWGRFAFPFAFRTTGPPLGPPPLTLGGVTITGLQEGLQLTVSVVPREPGITIRFVLPAGVVPARSNFPGRERYGRWTATYIAPPAEGIAWQASFRDVSEEQLRQTRVAVTSARLPGGSGWQSLPAWLPQETVVWSATATWVVPPSAGFGIAPVPPLR
jgi:hypothetical protein